AGIAGVVAARRDSDFRGDSAYYPDRRGTRRFEGASHWRRAADAPGHCPFHCPNTENFRNQEPGSLYEWNFAHAPNHAWENNDNGFARGRCAIDQRLPRYLG